MAEKNNKNSNKDSKSGENIKKSAKKENIHKDHRKRMRERFCDTGFKGWSKYEIIEFMLYNVYAQGDTNPISHAILNYNNNSLRRMFENSVDNRMAEDIHGVGEKTVLYLRTLKEFIDYYLKEELLEEKVRVDRENFPKILRSIRFSENYEDIYMLCMDRNMYLKSIVNLTEASDETAASVSTDRIVSCAVRAKASNIILLHNHPMGSRKPSLEDISMTERSSDALNSVGVFLVDHYIVCGKDLSSIRMSMLGLG